ncbi:hypothetical protein SUGI_0797130 [Cryptomeria japonica]|nr:hypothetical protein SUGI_0797130 [Cryptomeria japonica]
MPLVAIPPVDPARSPTTVLPVESVTQAVVVAVGPSWATVVANTPRIGFARETSNFRRGGGEGSLSPSPVQPRLM